MSVGTLITDLFPPNAPGYLPPAKDPWPGGTPPIVGGTPLPNLPGINPVPDILPGSALQPKSLSPAAATACQTCNSPIGTGATASGTPSIMGPDPAPGSFGLGWIDKMAACFTCFFYRAIESALLVILLIVGLYLLFRPEVNKAAATAAKAAAL